MCDRKTEWERDSGVGVFPSAFSLILCPPIPGKLDVKWQSTSHTLCFYGATAQYDEGWKLHHVSVRLLCSQSDISSFTIQTLSAPYYRLSSTFSFISLLIPLLLWSSCLLSSLPSCHFVYIWKADRAFGSHSNRIECVSVLVCVWLKSRGWFAALPLQL